MPTPKRVPTRKDVANLAGVSETVVSYVINNNRYVASEKRERVLKAIEELKYRPSSIARAMKGKGVNAILFICDNMTNEHFGKIVDEMDRLAYDRNYLISLIRGRNDERFVNQVLSHPFDGIVISSADFDEKYVLQLIDSGIPVVLLINKMYYNIGNRASRIYTGLDTGMRAAVRFLTDQGRRHILYVDRFSLYHGIRTIEDWRSISFVTQMQECGLQVSPNNILVGFETGEEMVRELDRRIGEGMKVDAVIGRNDEQAYVAMSALQQRGFRVPEDVSVIGFDNSSLSSYVSPQISSIDIDRKAIAQAILQFLDSALNGGTPQEVHLHAKLVERESTRLPSRPQQREDEV